MGKQTEHLSEYEGASRKYEKQDQNTWEQSKAAKNLHQTARWWSDIWGSCDWWNNNNNNNNNNAVLGHYTMSQCPYKFTDIEK